MEKQKVNLWLQECKPAVYSLGQYQLVKNIYYVNLMTENKFQFAFRISHSRVLSNILLKGFLEAAAKTVGPEIKAILRSNYLRNQETNGNVQ